MTDASSRPGPASAAPSEAPASAGGAGAPPTPGAANLAAEGLTRAYDGAGIRVGWYASRCIHSAACIRALPTVFDPKARPWVDLSAPGADADAVASAVLRCPTGALHFQRLDGGPQEVASGDVRVTATRDGPYVVRGAVEIRDDAGRVLRTDTRLALCRCGHTNHPPFCDNTHRAIGFRSTASPAPTGAA